jgi:hypothetical protein
VKSFSIHIVYKFARHQQRLEIISSKVTRYIKLSRWCDKWTACANYFDGSLEKEIISSPVYSPESRVAAD